GRWPPWSGRPPRPVGGRATHRGVPRRSGGDARGPRAARRRATEVVRAPALVVDQQVVGLCRLGEPSRGTGVVTVGVGMEPTREGPIRVSDVVGRRGGAYAEDR